MSDFWREIAAVRYHLRGLGAARAHEDRVLRLWLHALAQDGGRRRIEDFLPRALREALPALSAELAGLARIASRHPARDGSERLLVELGDGQSFVIAGLAYMSDTSNEARTPGLASLPVIGALFKTSQVSRERQELIVVATPRLVSPLDHDPLEGVELDSKPADTLKRLGLSR